DMKTPSTSRPFKNAYTISVSEHIKRVLSNRTLRSQMYFGPGIEAETKSEFWHGNIWQESPLFSQSSIQINQ
ncbi:2044_t:CDS:1, partial [Gigaspora rosea]